MLFSYEVKKTTIFSEVALGDITKWFGEQS